MSIVSVSHYHYHYLTISLSILSLSICVNCFCISLLLKIRSCFILLKTVSYFLSQACRRNFLYLILFIISFIFSSQIYRSLIDIFLDSFFYLVLFYIDSLSRSLSERFFSLSYYLLVLLVFTFTFYFLLLLVLLFLILF